MSFKYYRTFGRKCNNLCSRLISWVLRISNYKLPMPSYKASQVKDKEFLLRLAHSPEYRDLCLWVMEHRDRAISRLLSSNSEERENYIGQINAYDEIYRKIIVEVARKKNLED